MPDGNQDFTGRAAKPCTTGQLDRDRGSHFSLACVGTIPGVRFPRPLQCSIASDLFGDPTRTCSGAFINVPAACKPVLASCGTVAGSKKPARGSHDFPAGSSKRRGRHRWGFFRFSFSLIANSFPPRFALNPAHFRAFSICPVSQSFLLTIVLTQFTSAKVPPSAHVKSIGQ